MPDFVHLCAQIRPDLRGKLLSGAEIRASVHTLKGVVLLGSRPRGLLLGRVQDLEDAQLHPSVEALAAPAPEDQIHYRVNWGGIGRIAHGFSSAAEGGLKRLPPSL